MLALKFLNPHKSENSAPLLEVPNQKPKSRNVKPPVKLDITKELILEFPQKIPTNVNLIEKPSAFLPPYLMEKNQSSAQKSTQYFPSD